MVRPLFELSVIVMIAERFPETTLMLGASGTVAGITVTASELEGSGPYSLTVRIFTV